MNAENQLLEAMTTACREVGILPPDALPAFGRWVDADIDGDPHGKGDGRVKLFLDGEGGIACNWKTSEKEVFFAGDTTSLTPEEKAVRHQAREAARIRAQVELDEAHDQTALKAKGIDADASKDISSHPYAAKKKVSFGSRLRRGAWAQRGWPDALLIQLFNSDGELRSLEAINVDGEKDYLKGGQKKGCFYPFGKIRGAECVLLGEGVASVAAAVESTGLPAAAAMDSGNLLYVAKEIRRIAPDAEIIILADNDIKLGGSNPGLTAATAAAMAIGGKVAVPEMGKACDFWDLWNEQGADAIKQAVSNANERARGKPQPEPDNAPAGEYASRIVVVNLMDFVTRDIKPRERILAPWLLTQSINMLYAWRGVGKTHVALGIAYAVASGGGFLKWKAQHPRRVLFLDGEMPAASMQERLKGLVASTDDDFDPDFFRLVTPDLQTGAMPDLATAAGQEAIDAIMGDTELIVADNLSSLARSGGAENDASSWLPIQPWALRQRQQGRSVLFVHHSGKGGAQRGTSKKEDILDTVLTLKRPADYNPADGAVFEVHFEKTRDMHGDDAQPFEARLQTDEQGQSTWSFNSVEDSTFDRVVTLANEGLSQKEIADELGVNKSNVSRHIRRATDAGLIQKGGGHASH